MSNGNITNLPISPDLMEILRDPYAITQGDKYGPDPGRLTLVDDCWLVSADTGYKYPIRDGIPVMLVEEGARWKDTPVDALPVPPPSAEALPVSAPSIATASGRSATDSGPPINPILYILGGITIFALLFWFLSRLFGDDDNQDIT